MADIEPIAPVSFKKRSAKGKTNIRKRAATPPPPASDTDSGFTLSEDESGHRIKRRRTKGVVTASSAANRPVQPQEPVPNSSTIGPTILKPSDDATKTSNWFDAEQQQFSSKELLGTTRSDPSAPDGTYKGVANYTSFIQKNPDRISNKTVGPVKQASNVRTITVTDFAPDVCKDYRTSGFCGYGDSCKFLHAREDYKQGWELDRDWEIGTKGGKINTQGKTVASANRTARDAENANDADEALLESIPFACIICKEPYTYPIVTKCGHYFCEKCALQRYRKKPDCAACGAGTGGVFNVAKKLVMLLERKKERVKKRKEEARARGEEVSSDDEDQG
ncbi:putative ccch and ring finger protein [Phaeomoniella chlamydospora]|uniref:Pre-mRNA-splicing factor CWC24 n=1 Tax=Phaeomoniella chlamydospora TaxID=158046 RepID=A0A0G2ETZ6_PHACM|nr:putative ccch and ring finger protein [Phaeomoniella chlamydospora]